ncbi:MAG: ABC transporter permease, partial [Cellulosilyticaceae bacterium]
DRRNMGRRSTQMKKKNIYAYLMLAPVMSILIGVFVIGLIESIAQSLGYFPAIGKYEWTFRYYIEVLTRNDFLGSVGYTLFFSFISAGISAIGGIMVAYCLLKTDTGQRFSELMLRLPIYVPHIVGVALVYILFNQTGMLARVWYMLGLIQDPNEFAILVQDPKGIGIILVYLWKGIPFVMLTVLTILRDVDQTLVVAAKNLGASNTQIFCKIQLPLILPSVVSSFIILFAFAFGGFEVPYLIGASTPKALPVLSYMEHTSSQVEHRIYAMVLNVIMIGVSFVLVGCYMKVTDQIKKYR